MQLKIKNLKLLNKKIFITLGSIMFGMSVLTAQNDLVIDESKNLNTDLVEVTVADTTAKPKRFRVDGVAGVVGDNVVLESDIDKTYIELQQQNISIADITRCELFGKLLEDKLYAHQAIQDSIVVPDSDINNQLNQQLDYIVSQLGSEEKAYKYYRKNSMEELRKELFEIIKTNRLGAMMQDKITSDIEITPEEVRQFFYSIPEDERPFFGAELEVAQIVIEPEITEESRKEVIDQLNQFRQDILENGVPFSSRAVIYSQDPGSATKGGLYTIDKKTPFIKEFKDVAYSLREGEVSEPFETEFGFHILTVDKIRGQDLDIRHILLIPEVTDETIAEARKKIDNLRDKIVAGHISFADAARAESDEKETRNDGGQLINPETFDTRFELTKMDPTLSSQVYNLEDNEVSKVFVDEDRTGRKSFKILTVTNRYEEHNADYAKDFEKIKSLALRDKQVREVEKWLDAKIKDTYINISKEYVECPFSSNWVKK